MVMLTSLYDTGQAAAEAQQNTKLNSVPAHFDMPENRELLLI